MSRKSYEFIFYNLTRVLMLLMFCGCVYLLRAVLHMAENPASAMRLYHSFPEMAEYIFAGILFYLACGILSFKAAADAV